MTERYLAALYTPTLIGETVPHEVPRIRMLNKFEAPNEVLEQFHRRIGEIAHHYTPLQAKVYDVAYLPRNPEVVVSSAELRQRRSFLDTSQHMRVRMLGSPSANILHGKLYHAARALDIAFDERGMGLGGFQSYFLASRQDTMTPGEQLSFPALFELAYDVNGPEIVLERFDFDGETAS